jgi:hypothetical protein
MQKLLSIIKATHTEVKEYGNDYITGVYKDVEYQYLIYNVNECTAFYIKVFDGKKIDLYDGFYTVLFYENKYNLIKTQELSEFIMFEKKYEAVVIDGIEYQKLYFDDIKHLIRKVIE